MGLVVVVCVAFGFLGAWQLGVARDRGTQQALQTAAAQPVVPLDEVLRAQQGFPLGAEGRRVRVRGSYDASRQVLVADRLQRGRPGWWVVGALRTDSGAWLPAVRGWVPSPDDERAAPGRAPTGGVEVMGVLQPDDAGRTSGPEPGTRLTAIDAAQLVNRWGPPIYNGFVIVVQESGAAPRGTGPERVPPPVPRAAGIAWRNAAYAVQWWVFAGFAVLLWWKMVRQDALQPSQAVAERVSA